MRRQSAKHHALDRTRHAWYRILMWTVSLSPGLAVADCFDDAAARHGVNPWIMRAIVFKESSFNPRVVHRPNSDNSTDHGWAGINSVHLRELSRFGISSAQLTDPCTGIYVGSWHLAKKMRRYGNTWAAVGSYHSKTPSKRDQYAMQIRRIVEQWAQQGYLRLDQVP